MILRNPKRMFIKLGTIKLGIPDREPLGHMKLTVGVPAIVIGGKNVGKYGKITAIEEKTRPKT